MLQEILEICQELNGLPKGIFEKKPLLITLLCSFILLENLLSVEADLENTGCKIVRASDILIGDCYAKGISRGIPQYLESGLKVLNLSRNNIYNVTNHSFTRYKDTLTILDMSNLRLWRNNLILEQGTFNPLFKLEYLDMTNSCWSRKFALPTNIRILKIENCSTLLNVAHLKLLEEFHAAGNNWTEAPRFHMLAPLKYVDLRRNALNYFPVESIAPYCELKAIFLDGFPSRNIIRKNLNNATIYCTCRAFDSWLTSYGIKHRQLECIPPPGSIPICTSLPSDEALKLRRVCLARIASKTVSSVKTNLWIIVSAIAILCLLLFSSLIVSRGRSGQDEKSDTQDEEVEEHEGEEDH